MLFYSFEFMYLFLPMALLGFHVASKYGRRPTTIWLVFCSLGFYAWWNPPFVLLLVGSMLFNYFCGTYLQKNQNKNVMIAGIALNLVLLGYFKYMGFLVSNINAIAGTTLHVEQIFLPLAISFYTFQQVAFLVDSCNGMVDTKTEGFWRYALFVTFFPQLIAGPIVHHKEMMPQFSDEKNFRLQSSNFYLGLCIFSLGLFKKIIIADGVASIASPIFDVTNGGGTVSMLEAWVGAVAYMLQMYFDFSGYSDMAIGLGRMFNIRLPINFNSPLQATSITQLWQRWHITMTRFFTVYLFNPLSMVLFRRYYKYGDLAIYATTFISLFFIGLWHGANWTYVLFGIMQAVFLVAHKIWNKNGYEMSDKMGVFFTFVAFTISHVMYSSTSINSAFYMYISMVDLGHVLPADVGAMFLSFGGGEPFRVAIALITFVAALLVVFVAPNTLQITKHMHSAYDTKPLLELKEHQKIFRFSNSRKYAFGLALMVVVSLIGVLDASRIKEFIYFQF